MSTEILINWTPMETRVARVEGGLLREVSIERTHQRGLVGNIYRGKVARVLPGMQAAFVDIGLQKAGFIHADDIWLGDSEKKAAKGGCQTDIRQLLREGQSVVVQVMKDPIGTKGARLTTELSISSRYLVYLPQGNRIGISQRIDCEEERNRLRELLDDNLDNQPGGYIVRTAADSVGDEELLNDRRFLLRLWDHISETRGSAPEPSVIYEELPLHFRAVRDTLTSEVERIRIDASEICAEVTSFLQRFNPEMASLVERYTANSPLFYLYNVEDEITRALAKKIMLKSGGYLLIEQTEAMVTIDVNTGTYVGHRNLEETIYKTNLEAVEAIARQLRLRNLGGIIIIDFIDMADAEHRRQVHRMLEKNLAADRARTVITGVSDLGLVEMTRKRTSESLGQMLCEPCPMCEGRGSLKSSETVCHEILREILREARAFESDKFLVLASAEVIDRLLDENSADVADLEEFLGRTLEFRVESLYSREQFDIIPG